MLNKYLCCSYQYNWYLCTCTVKIYTLLWTFLIGLSELCIILPAIIAINVAFNKVTSRVHVSILDGIYVPVFGLLSLFYSWGHHGRVKVVQDDHTLNKVLYYFIIIITEYIDAYTLLWCELAWFVSNISQPILYL